MTLPHNKTAGCPSAVFFLPVCIFGKHIFFHRGRAFIIITPLNCILRYVLSILATCFFKSFMCCFLCAEMHIKHQRKYCKKYNNYSDILIIFCILLSFICHSPPAYMQLFHDTVHYIFPLLFFLLFS